MSVEYLRERLEDITCNYMDKNTCFGFDEGIELDDKNLKIKGYTYYHYGSDQMYVMDGDVLEELTEKDISKYKTKAQELFGSTDDEHIISSMDYFEYKELARNLINRIKRMKRQEAFSKYDIKAEISDSDCIFVDIQLGYKFPKNPNDMSIEEIEKELVVLDALIDETMDAIKAYKYG